MNNLSSLVNTFFINWKWNLSSQITHHGQSRSPIVVIKYFFHFLVFQIVLWFQLVGLRFTTIIKTEVFILPFLILRKKKKNKTQPKKERKKRKNRIIIGQDWLSWFDQQLLFLSFWNQAFICVTVILLGLYWDYF